jgi:hypothetical protein
MKDISSFSLREVRLADRHLGFSDFGNLAGLGGQLA